MSQTAHNPDSSSRPALLILSLQFLAVFCTVTGLLVGLWRALQSPEVDGAPASPVMAGLLVFVGALVAAGLLWAAAHLLGVHSETRDRQRRLLETLQELRTPAPTETPQASEPGPNPTAELKPLLTAIREELTELNTNMLLSTQQREAKRFRKQSQRAEQLARQVRQSIRAGEFDEAEEMLERLIHEIPDDPHLEELRDSIEEARREQSRHLVQQEVRRTADLMAVARFDEAIDVAREIEDKHGQQPETQGLLQRVMQEAQTYELQQRRRLYAQITEHAEAREWKLALETAHRLLEKFPDSEQAGQVRNLMPTLVDNARIEEVRGLRDRILDLMERRRYAEAAQLAHHVIENYPETAAAEELRPKLQRLQQLAAGGPDAAASG